MWIKSLAYFKLPHMWIRIRSRSQRTGFAIYKKKRRTLWEAADDDLIAGDAGPDLVLYDGVDGLGGAPQSLDVRLLLQVVQRFCEHERASSKIQVFTSTGQYWGYGFGAGSACFWASRIRIHLSDVWIRIWILPFSHKGVERTDIMLAK